MKINDFKKTLVAQIKAMKAGEKFLNLYLKSQPGVGKSSIIHQTAAEYSMPVIDVRGAQLDPVDLRGLPYVKEGVMVFSDAGFLPRESRDGKFGILFLDEVAQSPLAVQNAMLQLVLDRRLGDYQVPEGWLIVAAGNRDIDRAGAGRITTALGNRVVHIELNVDHDEWHNWGVAHGMRADILAFIKRRSNLLSVFNPKEEINATPRSWEFANVILNQGHELDIEAEMLEGAVGKGPATEFMGFRKCWKDLPNIEKICAGSDEKMSDKPDVQYATTISLSLVINGKNCANVLKWMQSKLPAEFTAMMIKDAQARLGRDEFVKEIARNPEFSKWAVKSGQKVMAA